MSTNANSGGFQFTPPTGLLDTTAYPTTPASETAARQQFMDLFNQLLNEINNPTASGSAYYTMSRQALINGNFDIWQRGTSWTNPSNLYTADRWIINGSANGVANAIHSRQLLNSGELDKSFYFNRLQVDGAGTDSASNNYILRQRIENGTRYLCGNGKKVTISFWARSSISGKRIGVNIDQIYGSGGSPTSPENITGTAVTLTSTWTKYTVTITTNTLSGKTFGTNNDDYLQISLWYMWGSTYSSRMNVADTETFRAAGTIDIAQVEVNAGDQALPFQPRSFADELSLCQRYYEKSYNYDNAPGTPSASGMESRISQTSVVSGGNLSLYTYSPIIFRTPKRVVPTVNIYNRNNGVSNSVFDDSSGKNITFTGISTFISGNKNALMNLTGLNSADTISANDLYSFQWTADAEL